MQPESLRYLFDMQRAGRLLFSFVARKTYAGSLEAGTSIRSPLRVKIPRVPRIL
jgi:hypothetical protein